MPIPKEIMAEWHQTRPWPTKVDRIRSTPITAPREVEPEPARTRTGG
jgi:hypothetical protein